MPFVWIPQSTTLVPRMDAQSIGFYLSRPPVQKEARGLRIEIGHADPHDDLVGRWHHIGASLLYRLEASILFLHPDNVSHRTAIFATYQHTGKYWPLRLLLYGVDAILFDDITSNFCGGDDLVT